MSYGYIYKTTNLVNGKIYIGKHSTKKVRDTQLLDESYFGSGIKLNKAINKYGLENFTVEILEWCDSKDELNIREKYWISSLNARDYNVGYNLASGGDGGDLGEEARRKAALAHIGRPSWNSGTKGLYSDEYRKKLSEAHMGKHPWNYGTKNAYSDSYRKALSEAAIKNRGKQVMCIETGVVYRSSKDACIELGLDVSLKKKINVCCCGHRKSAFNLHWKYIN